MLYNIRMNSTSRYLWPLIFLIFPSIAVFSQNEAQFKALVKGVDKLTKTKKAENKDIRIFSDYYRIDLNGDGHLEGIAVENSDQGSSLHFFKNHFEHFQELKVSSGASFSKIDRLEVKSISPTENIIMIFYSEGLSKYLTSRSRQRLYLVYVPKNIFNSPFEIFKGPIVFEEFEKRGHYHIRKYDIFVEDINHDGVKEVLVKNKIIERVMVLSGDKKFKML